MLAAGTSSAWYDFLPALTVTGLGIGLVFAPLTTIAMRRVPERLAGAASGVLNTMRQAGSVIGTAAVGALLQNRLVAALTAEATAWSALLPATARGPFVAGFLRAASSGAIGGSTTGSAVKQPAGTPASVARELPQLAAQVFGHGYVGAMRWTMLLPITIVALAAVSALAIRQPPARVQQTGADTSQEPVTGTAS